MLRQPRGGRWGSQLPSRRGQSGGEEEGGQAFEVHHNLCTPQLGVPKDAVHKHDGDLHWGSREKTLAILTPHHTMRWDGSGVHTGRWEMSRGDRGGGVVCGSMLRG